MGHDHDEHCTTRPTRRSRKAWQFDRQPHFAAGMIPAGDVDTRSIHDVRPHEIARYTQQHFFAGIGGWPLALRLAGWPDNRPVRSHAPASRSASQAKAKAKPMNGTYGQCSADVITFGEATISRLAIKLRARLAVNALAKVRAEPGRTGICRWGRRSVRCGRRCAAHPTKDCSANA
jgi:hypothetical protein